MMGRRQILAKLRGKPTDSLRLMPIAMMFATDLANLKAMAWFASGRS